MASILIVDDRPDFRQALAELLGSKGHRIIAAAHGEHALEVARSETPDLVITDGLMPVMDGFEMLEKHVAERTVELAADNTKLVEEVRQRRRAQARLQAMVDRDSLTGLYNRRYFDQAVAREIARAKRERATFGVAFADADNFKELNDVHGHAAGDAVLVTLGHHLQACVRTEDIVCRYGGEEFVVLLVRANTEGIVIAAERMRAGVNALRIPGFAASLLPPTLSIGTAVWPDHGHDSGALIRAADAALYRAKRAGRNRVEMATPQV
jgi:diguanylate cyclase (GGDEF)-like protein